MVRTRMLALSTGIMLAALLPVSSGQLGHWVLLPGFMTCVYPWWRQVRHHPRLHACLTVFACILLGAGYALWRGHLYAERLLPPVWEGHDLWVHGHVTGLPQINDAYRRIEFRVHSSCLALLPEECAGRTTGFSSRLLELTVHDDTLALLPGQRWWLRVRLWRPRSTVNPGIMDREAHWFRRGVAATGYVRETAFNHQTGTVFFEIDRWRHQLLRQLQLPGPRNGQQGLVNALVVGDRSGISDAQWQLFSDTGTSHLVVISGLHVGFVAWSVYVVTSLSLKRIPGVLVRWPAPLLAGSGALSVAIGYAALAGFSLPTRRALVMLLVIMTGRLSGRQLPVSLGFSVALFVVLLLDPLAVVSAGFWYSFTAVGVLLLVFSGRTRTARHTAGRRPGALWEQWGRAQWVVFLGLLVPMMIWHGSISPLAPLANVLAIPFVSLVVVPLCLLAAFLTALWVEAGRPLVAIAARCLQWLEGGLAWLRDVAGDLASLSLPVLSPAALICLVLAVLLLLMPRGWPLRNLALPLLLPLFLIRQPGLSLESARILVADVGQGLGLIIQTRNHTVVYDAGPGPALMSRMLGAQMRRRGHERIHAVILSHRHADHSGGIPQIREQMVVDRWLTGSSPLLSGFKRCEAGRQWSLDGVLIRFLHPPEPSSVQTGNENNRSCVLHVQAGDNSMLIPGDIEMAIEAVLVAEQADRLRADVLLVPHHGSRSSSTGEFLDAVQPSLAIYSAARNNRFSHPAEEVMRRYRDRSIRMLGTPGSGAIQLCLGPSCGGVLLKRRHRADPPRYWRHS